MFFNPTLHFQCNDTTGLQSFIFAKLRIVQNAFSYLKFRTNYIILYRLGLKSSQMLTMSKLLIMMYTVESFLGDKNNLFSILLFNCYKVEG